MLPCVTIYHLQEPFQSVCLSPCLSVCLSLFLTRPQFTVLAVKAYIHFQRHDSSGFVFLQLFSFSSFWPGGAVESQIISQCWIKARVRLYQFKLLMSELISPTASQWNSVCQNQTSHSVTWLTLIAQFSKTLMKAEYECCYLQSVTSSQICFCAQPSSEHLKTLSAPNRLSLKALITANKIKLLVVTYTWKF